MVVPTFVGKHLPLGKFLERHQFVMELGHFLRIGILLEGKVRLVRLTNHHVGANGPDRVFFFFTFIITQILWLLINLALVLSGPFVLVLLSHPILNLLKLISKLRCFKELRGGPPVLDQACQAAPILKVIDTSLGNGENRVSA